MTVLSPIKHDCVSHFDLFAHNVCTCLHTRIQHACGFWYVTSSSERVGPLVNPCHSHSSSVSPGSLNHVVCNFLVVSEVCFFAFCWCFGFDFIFRNVVQCGFYFLVIQYAFVSFMVQRSVFRRWYDKINFSCNCGFVFCFRCLAFTPI